MTQRSDRYRLASFAAWQSGAFAISGALRLIAVGLIGRALGPTTFGHLQYAASLYVTFFALSEFGLVTLGTRNVAREPQAAAEHVRRIARARGLMSGLALGLLLLAAPWIAVEERVFLALYGLGLVIQAATFDWALRGLGRMRVIAVAEVLRGLIYLGAVLLLVHGPGDVLWVIFLQHASALGVAVWLGLALRREWVRRARETDPKILAGGDASGAPTIGRSLRAAAPIAAGDLVAGYYGQADLLALRWLAPVEAVGFYAPGLRMLGPLILLVGLSLQAWLPVMTEAHAASKERFAGLLNDLLVALAWLMVPAAAAGWLLAPTLVRVFFGAEYAPAGEPFQLLLVSLAVLAWRAPLSMAFIASGREWTYLGVILAVTAVKTAACALLVPQAGTAGAAGAAIVAELAFAAGSVLCLRVVSAGSLVRPLFGPLLAGAAAAAVFLAVRNAGAGAAWAAALLTYALIAWNSIGRRALRLLRRQPQSEELRPGRSGPPTAS